MRVVHVIQCLSRGGAGRALLALAAATPDVESSVVSLLAADPLMRSRAEEARIEVLEAPEPAVLRSTLEQADVVQVHFWNTPELYELLRAGLPPCRLAVWAHVAGDTAPQVLTSQVVDLADIVVVTASRTAQLPVFREPPLVAPGDFDPGRLSDSEPRPHATFNVGYVGTLDFGKLNPSFVELTAAIDVPGVRFVVCGSGDASAAIARETAEDERFELRGYVEDIGSVLAELDVFGYPLARGNYSTSDLALQEAMSVGVPPVVLPYGAAASLVEDRVTGLVARDEAEYARAVERLFRDPAERLRLGRNAREQARPGKAAAAWARVYDGLMELPKGPRRRLGSATGAAAFVESLGGEAPEFAVSLFATVDEAAEDAERLIAAATPVMASAGGGGVLHYRRHYPADGYLSLWAGLVLEGAGRHVLAAGEYSRARKLGCDAPRVARYLARAASAAGAVGVAS